MNTILFLIFIISNAYAEDKKLDDSQEAISKIMRTNIELVERGEVKNPTIDCLDDDRSCKIVAVSLTIANLCKNLECSKK